MSDEIIDHAEINDVLNNPYMGWAPWAEGGPYQQPHRLVYGQLLWSELEPVKNIYNWSFIEAKLKFNYWAGRNVKLILRLMMDLPGISLHKDIPEWLYSEINREGTWYSRGFSPNYKNPALAANHERLVAALAQRYNNDPRIAFIEIGSLGHWGEFHTVYLSSSSQGYMPPINISDRYMQHYLNGFKNKKLLMRRPFQIAKDNNLGLYNDMFGSPTETPRFLRYANSGYTNTGNYGLAAGIYPAMPDYWKYGPSGGEFAESPGAQYFSDSNINQTLQYAADSHISWLGPRCPVNEEANSSLQKNINMLLNRMGYRFVLDTESHAPSVNSGSALTVRMQWSNKGTAPFYYKWPLELSLADGSGNIAIKANTPEDIRTWLPGSKPVTYSLNIPASLPAGSYTLCAAILDPDSGLPGIAFAMTGRRSDGRYGIGKVIVNSIPLPSPIVIDGNLSDWNGIGAVSEAGRADLMKVTNDSSDLFICIQGKGINTKSSIYINSDTNGNTGFNVPGWSSTGCDYLLENNCLYEYSGDGSSWSWSQIGVMDYAKNDTALEASIPLYLMNLYAGCSIKLGYVMNDSTTIRLPSPGEPLATYTIM